MECKISYFLVIIVLNVLKIDDFIGNVANFAQFLPICIQLRKFLLYILLIAVLPQLAGAVGALVKEIDEGALDAQSPDTVETANAPLLDAAMNIADSLVLPMLNDSSPMPEMMTVTAPDSDSIVMEIDTFETHIRPVTTKMDLEAAVDFSAADSVIIVRRDSAFMYGNSSVEYGDMKLEAANIEMNLRNNNVYAVGVTDTTGEIQGKPIFSQGGSDYEAATMRYNFKTQKGFITNVVTQQGEGYLTGGIAKKNKEGDYFLKDGRYTTCDDHDHPHFYFQLTKAKVRPGKNTVSGPAYMVLAGLPLPLAVPFGYFPFTDSYASGIIVPSFGDDYQRGFYLRDGGYYFAISDNIDLALTGELYTKGSWGINARSTYAKRYKYSGNFNLSYLKSIYGEKGSPDYSSQTNFQILWSHTQDSKANPNMNLSASVNFTTSGYSRNDLNSYYNSSFTENTKSSTINMTYRIPQSKWSFSTTMNVSQRTQDSTLSVSFPNITATMSQTYPFKRKKAAGDERWYEKIKISYSGQFQNSLTAKQNEFFKKSLIKDWRNGMRHSIPISATFNLFNYINLTPSINFTDRMYTTKVRRQWDPNASVEVCDTSYSLYNVYDFQASVSLDTKIYGFWRPIGPLAKKVTMIRHVMTPSVSFSGAPDFGSSFFGYYDQYSYIDSEGREQTRKYSLYPNALYGVPSEGKTGTVSFQLANNLEMKMKTDNDSIGEKKISLIENFTIGQSYNFAADSLNWSNINTSLLLRLTKGFNLNLQATWDVYMYGLNQAGNPVRLNKLRIANGKGFGRLSSTGTSFSYTFNNDTFKKKKKDDSKNNKNNDNNNNDEFGDNLTGGMNDRNNHDSGDDGLSSDGYTKWEVPWSLSVNYSIGYGYGNFNKEKMEYDPRITQNLSFSGNINPTKNWSFSFSASYNFDTHKLAYMNCNISRDLHCFAMRASFVPVGPYKSYTFNIAVKSSMLSDLKYDKRSSMRNGVTWY